MPKITEVGVEHNGNAVFGERVIADTFEASLDQALAIIKREAMTSPGIITRAYFGYDGEGDD